MDPTQDREAPSIPLESYAPILQRALMLGLNYIPAGVRVIGKYDFSNWRSRANYGVLMSAYQASGEKWNELRNAVETLYAIQPNVPELYSLHEAARTYMHVIMKYYNAADSAYKASMTEEKTRVNERLQKEEMHLKQVLEAAKEELQKEIRAIYSDRELIDGVGFTVRGLWLLDLGDLAEWQRQYEEG